MPSIEVGEVRLAYELAGEAGAPVLLIMGLGMPRQGWAAQVRALAPHYRVAFFDNRGVGGTEAPPPPWRIADMAADALGLIDALGWADAHVAGISMGGMIAQELALAARDRVRSLALLSTSYRGFGWRPSAAGLAASLLVTVGRGETRLRALQHQLFSPEALRRVDPETATRQMQEALGSLPPARTFVAQYHAVLRFRSKGRLARLAGLPTLIVQPGRDRVIHPGESERLARALPGARLERLPGSGHGVVVEEAEAVNRLLLDHFRRADEGRAAATPEATGAAG